MTMRVVLVAGVLAIVVLLAVVQFGPPVFFGK
jgi:hypothetical protein